MFCGAIPITNAGDFMATPFEDGRNCVAFFGEPDFVEAIQKAIAMPEPEIDKMREEVIEYYSRLLEPGAFASSHLSAESAQVLVNAEENSVPKIKEFQSTVRAFMEKYTA
jgi:hypothetical protein